MSEFIEEAGLPLCACDCGGRVSKPENIYIYNHHTGGKHVQERRRKGLLRRQRVKWFVDRTDKTLLDAYAGVVDMVHREWKELNSYV